MSKYLEFKNISTILNSILLTIFGLLIGYLASIGLNLPVNAETLTSIGTGLILLCFSYYNARNPNTLFDAEADTIYLNVDELDEQQVRAINNFIENSINNKNVNTYGNADILEDIDPAGEYTYDTEENQE